MKLNDIPFYRICIRILIGAVRLYMLNMHLCDTIINKPYSKTKNSCLQKFNVLQLL